MGAPQEYYVDHVGGDNSVDGWNGPPVNDGSSGEPWKTVQFALQVGIKGGLMGSGTHHANGVQINIKAGADSGEGEITTIDIQTDYTEAPSISQAAPLILRGYQTSPGDWYPGKAGDEPTLYGFHYPGTGTNLFTIVSDDGTSMSGKESNHILFCDLVFEVLPTSAIAHVQAKSSNTFLNCKFHGGVYEGGCIDVTDDTTFINCHFSDMGDTGAAGRVAINHAGSGLTLINCVFDFLAAADTTPYACLKISGTGSHHLIGNVFMCGNDTRIMNWGGTPSGLDSGLLVLINNTFYSELTEGHARENAFVGTNSARRIVAIDNLSQGWAYAMPYKPSLNFIAIGGNSAYNNSTHFPDGTDPDVWFEFAGGNFSATDANSNKSLARTPFLDAANKKMSCRPTRSGGNEAVVGQGLSLYEGASTIVKRGDRGAVPRGPLTLPVDGGVIG